MLHILQNSVADANSCSAMEADTILKNRRSPKSQTSRGNLILSFLAILLLSSTSGFAQFSGGSGVENDPYIITTPAELAQLATYVNEGNSDYNDKYYKLGNDIDLSGYGENFNDGAGWIPIGVYDWQDAKLFKGVFDGNQKKITSLYINDTTLMSVGLFGYISGTVKNIGIVDADILCTGGAGIVTGRTDNGSSVLNCYSTGSINRYFDNFFAAVGGVVGSNSGVVSNCYSTASISVAIAPDSYSDSSTGGVVGLSWSGSITNCYSTGSIMFPDGGGYSAGGVMGAKYGGDLSNCAALNPSVKCNGSWGGFGVGRVVAYENMLSNNIAFTNMLNPDGNTTWEHKGLDQIDGADISIAEINADGTLGGRFTAENGWTTENGKLPGLFGNTVDMPEHLGGTSGINKIEMSKFTVYPNPTNGQLTIQSAELQINNYNIYNISGQLVMQGYLQGKATSLNVESLPNGTYYLKIAGQVAKFIKE